MHGVIQPLGQDVGNRRASPAKRAWLWIVAHRMVLLIVVVPTMIAAIYYYAIAADQYQSEAHFIVRTADTQKSSSGGGISQILASVGGENSSPEAMSVADYMTSHDVVAALRDQIGLIQMYRRPEIDVVSRLSSPQPTPEKLLRYYLDHTKVEINSTTGITVVQARAFRPADAYAITTRLLALGDLRINSLNKRALDDAIASSERQLSDAENALDTAQVAISRFRAQQRDIDPQGTGQAQTTLISQLTADLVQAQAQLASMGQAISQSSPQYVALRGRVQALQSQVAAQSNRLAGSGTTIASQLASYNELQLRQEFASKRYEAVAAALDRAREQVMRKQLYLVRVVNPNMPVKSQYPQRARIVGTIFLGLFVAYAIGWLILAGVREHEA